MSADEHSFRKLLPGFVIPAGTQVVLKVAKAFRTANSSNRQAAWEWCWKAHLTTKSHTWSDFTGGETVTACFHELALRRREVEDELGEIAEDMRPWIIYCCQVGSKAFGLASERFRRRLAGDLPASRAAALVAAATAGTTGVQGRRTG